jgi:transglutaminase-like putative cysteine protease
MTILTVRHVTTYNYKQPVAFGEHRMMLFPREEHDQRLLELKLDIAPEPAQLRWSRDVFGNRVAVARFATRAATLRFESAMSVDQSLTEFVAADIEEFARSCPFTYAPEDQPHLVQFIERRCPDPQRRIDAWAHDLLQMSGSGGTHAVLERMTRSIHETFKYAARHEKGIHEPLHTLDTRRGSCRDMAVFMMEAVRSLGLAARFVSGYLHVRSCAGGHLRSTGGGHVRGGNTHAWVQVFVPGCGWMDFDPSSGIIGNRGLVRAAVARDPRQAIPLHGTYVGSPADNLEMNVAVHVSSAASHESTPLATQGSGDIMRLARMQS